MTRKELVKTFPFFADKNLDNAFDQLTEVLTRDIIRKYIIYLIDNKKPFSLFLADVDNFKYINDGYGHKVGDKVLNGFSSFLMDIVGKRGVVGRYGGDEFIIVCEGITEYNDVWKVGHDINMAIGNLRFADLDLPSITISMGVARCPLDTTDYDELWNLADKALYRGKMKGRNCFIIYLPEKHKNLELKGKRDIAFTPMYLHNKIFTTLTETKNLSASIKNLCLFLVSYLMFDHLCIETETGMKFQVIHSLSKFKEFDKVDYNQIKDIVDNIGLVYINKVNGLGNNLSEEFAENLQKQNIVSTLYCRIEAFGNTYGYIRADMTSTVRIWQTEELNLIVSAAKAIGLMLYYNKKTIDALDYKTVEIVGKE